MPTFPLDEVKPGLSQGTLNSESRTINIYAHACLNLTCSFSHTQIHKNTRQTVLSLSIFHTPFVKLHKHQWTKCWPVRQPYMESNFCLYNKITLMTLMLQHREGTNTKLKKEQFAKKSTTRPACVFWPMITFNPTASRQSHYGRPIARKYNQLQVSIVLVNGHRYLWL